MNIQAINENLLNAASFDSACLDEFPGPIQLLTNGRLATMLTASGAGYVQLGQLAVTRWKPDPTSDSLGYFIFVRDLETNVTWSVGYQPTRLEPTEYKFCTTLGTASLARIDRDVTTQLEVCVADQWNVDLRRCILTNHADVARVLELTSYAELALNDRMADNCHPAFSKLFVETMRSESGVLLARRRPRCSDEQTLSACHFLVVDNEQGEIEFEMDRCQFIGRGRNIHWPLALESPGSRKGSLGSVLDSVFSLRRVMVLPPGESVTVYFGLGAGCDYAEVLEAAEQFSASTDFDKAFQAADGAALERIRQEGIPEAELPQLLSASAYRLFGFVPGADNSPRHLALANPNGEAAGANGNRNGQMQLEAASRFLKLHNIRKAPAERAMAYQSSGLRSKTPSLIGREDLGQSSPWKATSPSERLQFPNGFGGFSTDGREYVIHMPVAEKGGLRPTPMPWSNVVSNESIGFIVSETGAGNTWAANSRLNRLTPWQNDPVTNPHSEAFYLRDPESGEYWSMTPGPAPRCGSYEVRHGWGYTKFRHEGHGLVHDVTQFVPRHDSVKISRIAITNIGQTARRLSFFSYLQWELGEGLNSSNLATITAIDASQRAIFARNADRGEFANRSAFIALAGAPENAQFTADRTEFLGLHGDVSAPLAVTSGRRLMARDGEGLDPCAAIQTDFVIEPGRTVCFFVLLGETDSAAASAALIDKYQNAATVDDALATVQEFWRDMCSAIQIETPSPSLNLMANGWLIYQNISCRLWGRSSAQQSGGAYGFRDQLQDVSALVFHCPELTRAQIIRNAAHQFAEGDVLHWWHPPTSKGIRTNFADDLLWLPLVACEYVAATGDKELWRTDVRYLTGPPVPPGHPEAYFTPSESDQCGSIFEHCCRALDAGLTTGRNGLPLIGCGDWNDGMNRVGHEGDGESVWMAFFIDYILERMLPVCLEHGDQNRFDEYTAYRDQLRVAVEEAGWDGRWYRRAYFDDGTPLGTALAKECRIDALVQAWSVLSGAGSETRAAMAVAAAQEHLVDEQAGLIRLLYPPFDKMPHDPGYIKGYLPGIRENGGQYTHGVLWLIRAIAELGHGTRACQLLEMISPVSRTGSAEAVATYKSEPYVVAADVYGEPPHAGRAGWTWYTGSAGWMLRVLLESILGLHLDQGRQLLINPTISAAWPECKIRYRVDAKGTVYNIAIHNSGGREHGVKAASLDGAPLTVNTSGALVPLAHDGRAHDVVVHL